MINITRLFDVYESEDYLRLVMECMEGGELFDRVSELKRFSERDAADAIWPKTKNSCNKKQIRNKKTNKK